MASGNNHTLTPCLTTDIESGVDSSFHHEKTLRKVKSQNNWNSMKENEKGRHKRLKRSSKREKENSRKALLTGMALPIL